MSLSRQLFSIRPNLALSARIICPRPIHTSSVKLSKTYEQELKKRFPDLSKYDPILDFRDDETLPGGNPHRKKIFLNSTISETAAKNPDGTESVTETGSSKLLESDFIYDDDYEYPRCPPMAAVIEDKGEDLVFSENFGITRDTFRALRKKVLVIRRSVNMTGKGKIQTFNSLVVVGNGAGGAGYGEAKGVDIGAAVRKATERAIKNIIYFERYDGRTIFHDIEYKFKATKLKLFARPPGFGVRTNRNIHEVCSCMGITDLGAKVGGSRNPSNVIKAFFDALQHQNTPENIAKSRGKKMVDVQYQYYGVKTELTSMA